MDTNKILQACTDDVEILRRRDRSIVDLSIALDRATRQRRELIERIELQKHIEAERLHYICSACGETIRIAANIGILDSGMTLTCPACRKTTVVSLDTPANLAQRYRNEIRGRNESR